MRAKDSNVQLICFLVVWEIKKIHDFYLFKNIRPFQTNAAQSDDIHHDI